MGIPAAILVTLPRDVMMSSAAVVAAPAAVMCTPEGGATGASGGSLGTGRSSDSIPPAVGDVWEHTAAAANINKQPWQYRRRDITGGRWPW